LTLRERLALRKSGQVSPAVKAEAAEAEAEAEEE
jgi:hypothetical protein